MAPREYTRRRLAAVVGTGLASGLAGCSDVLSGADEETTAASTTTSAATTRTSAGTTAAGTTTATEPTTVETTTPDETTTPATTTTTESTPTTTTTTVGEPVKTDDPYAVNQAGKAAVRVAHMSPTAPTVDVAVDGTTLVTRLAFGNVSPYFVLEPGAHEVTVSPTGFPTTLFSQTLDVGPKTYTGVAIGEVAGSNRPMEFRQYGDLVDPLSPARTRVRLIHAVPDADTLDVTLGDRDVTLFEGVEYGTPSSYAHPRAGAARFEIRRATRAHDGEVYGTFDTNLPGGAVVTVFAHGYRSPENAPTDAALRLRLVADPRP